MSFTITGGSSNFKDVSVGIHPARCAGVVEIGTHLNEYMGDTKKRHQMVVLWDVMDETTDDERPLRISKFYTVSTHPESNFAKDLVSWRGRTFTDEEQAAFEPYNIVGAPCQLNIVTGNNGKSKIDSVLNAKGVKIAESDQPQLRFSIGGYKDGSEKLEDIPEWLQKFVLNSLEMKDEPAPAAPPAAAIPEEDKIPF